MKKLWNMPTLETLDINETRGGTEGDTNDGTLYDMYGRDMGPSYGGNTLYSKWQYQPYTPPSGS